MNIKTFITAVVALLVSTACGGTKQQTETSTSNETSVMAKDGKALVVFFSVRWHGLQPAYQVGTRRS